MDARIGSFAAADAKARFSELLDRAERGEEVTISRHGRAVARLVPIAVVDPVALRRERRLAWLAYRRANAITLGPDTSIRELIDEGRR